MDKDYIIIDPEYYNQILNWWKTQLPYDDSAENVIRMLDRIKERSDKEKRINKINIVLGK